MSFAFSFGFIIVSVFLLPALLASASPHSLAERAGPSIDLQLVGYTSLSPNDRVTFEQVTITPVLGADGHDKLFTVEGGWYGKGATAEEVSSTEFNNRAKSKPPNLLALGHNGGNNGGYFVIVKDDPLTLTGLGNLPFSNPRAPQIFPKVNLFPIPEEIGKFIVVGGWEGERATAKQLSSTEYEDFQEQRSNGLIDSPASVLAIGKDDGREEKFYAIFRDRESDQRRARGI